MVITQYRVRRYHLGKNAISPQQLRVLGLGLLEYGDVGVCVFPKSVEVFVSGKRPDAGSVGIRSLRGLRLQGIGTSHSQMRQRSRPAVPDDAAMVENLLELGGGSGALSGRKIRLPAYVHVIEAGNIVDKRNLPQLDMGSSLQGIEGVSRILSIQHRLCLNRRQPKRLHLRILWEAFSQVLSPGLGSRRIARHGKRKRGLDLDALTCRNQLQSLCRRLAGFRRIPVSRLLQGGIRSPYRPIFLAVRRMAESTARLASSRALAR